MYVFDTCRDFIRTVPLMIKNKTRPEDLDTTLEDHCLSGDTKVITKKGLIPIRELVGKEGYVKSVNGWQSFRSCRLTRKNEKVVKISFQDGNKVVCTPDHQFLTVDGRMVNAYALTNETSYVIMSFIGGILWRLTLLAAQFRSLTARGIFCAVNIFRKVVTVFIELYGNFISGKFQQIVISTTGMAIGQTTRFPTWNKGKANIIYRNIVNSTLKLFLNLRERKQSNGTVAKKVLFGTLNTQKEINRHGQRKDVLFVKKHFKQRFYKYSVLESAKTNRETEMEKIKYKKNVLFAAINIIQTNIFKVKLALGNAGELLAAIKDVVFPNRKGNKIISIEDCGTQDVYCLTVPYTHLFAIEGGIIVSNCADETRLFLMSRPIAPTMIIPERRLTRDEEIWKNLDKIRKGVKQRSNYDLDYLGSEG